MSIVCYVPDQPVAYDALGIRESGARLYFYQFNTTTPVSIYQDPAGATPAANPLLSLSDGTWPQVYWDNNTRTRVVKQSPVGAILPATWQVDDIGLTIPGLGQLFLRTDGSNVNMDAAQATAFRYAIGALSTVITSIQAGAGAVARFIQDKLRESVSVKDYGAVGDGVADDTAAIKAALTYASSLTPPPAIMFPRGTYLVTGAGPVLEMVDGLRFFGRGRAVINFTGTGALFNNTGKQETEIDHLNIYGTFAADTWAIRHAPSATGALSNHYHHCEIKNFGNGTVGAGIQVDSDSANCELGPHLFMANLTANVAITAPMDTLYLHNNILASPAAPHDAGPTWGVKATGAAGATTMRISHNNITSEGAGVFDLSGGGWVIDFNDIELTKAFTNDKNAGIILRSGAFDLDANTVSLHTVAGANYCVYFEDGVGDSSERNGTYTGFNTKAVRVNTSPGNIYGPSTANTGPSNLYSADNVGIILRESGSGSAQTWGYATPPSGMDYGRNGKSADGPINFTNNSSGANNAITTTFPAPLTAGLVIRVPLNYSLQVGANTLDYNGTGAKAIKSARNPANNIATAYSNTGLVTLFWTGTLWLDVSQ